MIHNIIYNRLGNFTNVNVNNPPVISTANKIHRRKKQYVFYFSLLCVSVKGDIVTSNPHGEEKSKGETYKKRKRTGKMRKRERRLEDSSPIVFLLCENCFWKKPFLHYSKEPSNLLKSPSSDSSHR